ncbi:MAG TPA: hypothetical protein VNM15_02155 [Candidatus Binatia bacterium]|nr:hypothetical protein [Candidatus Binatia bacterium]
MKGKLIVIVVLSVVLSTLSMSMHPLRANADESASVKTVTLRIDGMT